ncbi:MAG: N-acetyl-gamma-glutamyl-phosphate reductase [Bordetella sp.]|nr:MAG: N-acetyl-gamma-glutamyl-phosphate reductase [Bordetella sp.]
MDQDISKKPTIRVGIIGAAGYTGIELLKILLNHPKVIVEVITSRSEHGNFVSDIYPNFRGLTGLIFSKFEESNFNKCDVVFFATPHGIAMNYASELLENNIKIIDLSADFRFKDINIFEKYYGIKHNCPNLLQYSEYGLVELKRDVLSTSRIIGNPGCYPTTVLLGLAPLFEKKHSLIDAGTLIADCKSAVSGSGRRMENSLLFCEISDNVRSYGLPSHRHHPEIITQLKEISNQNINLTFVPHLVPMIRGMFSTIYARILPQSINFDFQGLFEERYSKDQFVDVMPFGSFPETRSVRSSNNLQIALHRSKESKDVLVIFVAQDNLIKGAVGQAIQNMNLMFSFPESTGLNYCPGFLP